jgi:hypothetical protein
MIEHGTGCPRCNPCPAIVAAIAAIGEWIEARELRSKAAWLRCHEFERERDPGRVQTVFDERGEVVEYELLPSTEGAAE